MAVLRDFEHFAKDDEVCNTETITSSQMDYFAGLAVVAVGILGKKVKGNVDAFQCLALSHV